MVTIINDNILHTGNLLRVNLTPSHTQRVTIWGEGYVN